MHSTSFAIVTTVVALGSIACGDGTSAAADAPGGAQTLGGSTSVLGGTSASFGGARLSSGGSPGTDVVGGAGGLSGLANGGTSTSGTSLGTGTKATGGTAAMGGTKTTGGTATMGGSGCGVEPATPNATAQTTKVLCYLHSQYGNHILSGQEENNDDNGMNYIFQNTGKYPAIRAFDVNNSKAPIQCVDHWKKGGLCLFGYHMGITPADGYDGSKTQTDINQVLTEGSAYNATFKARLDKTAAMLKTVQDADGVAIVRLFHEAGTGCKWFWWGMESPAQYVRLWKYTFEYMTVTKRLKNILWMVPLCGSPDAAFNPGKQYTDFGGADTYAGDGNYDPQNGLFNKTVAAFPNMPVALHECGPIPDPDKLKSTATKWLLFNVWTAPFYQSPSNSVEHLKAVYNHDYVITLDEMPGW